MSSVSSVSRSLRDATIDRKMQSLRSAALCLPCWLLCLCYVMAARADGCLIVRLPFSIFVGACAVVLVMSMPNTSEPGARSASRQEVLASTISICVVVGYISTLFEPICTDLAVIVADIMQPSLKKWWPTPKPPPPPPPPWWCRLDRVVFSDGQFPGFFIDAWKDRCWQVDWHVKVKIDDMLERWLPSLALGYITAGILFNVPLFVFRDIANSYAKRNNMLFSKVTLNDKGKMCLGIAAWACFLSILPAVRVWRVGHAEPVSCATV